MKAKTIFYLLFLGFFVMSVKAYERAPVAISPGSVDGVAVVAQSCPTFSWTAVEWAHAYRIAVFEAAGEAVLPYEEMQALSHPIMSKEILGRALSWTPSADERLAVGGKYVWYVQALDLYAQETWSEGKMFRVAAAFNFDGVEEKVRNRLQEQGVSEEVIEDVLENIKSGVVDVVPYGVDTGSIQDRMRIQDLEGEETDNTFFGLTAGASLGSGAYYNSFFGNGAGSDNISGDNNTFIGHSAGINSTTNDNTFIGYQAGFNTTSGPNNIFLGSRAGLSNLTGHSNTFLGVSAGYDNTTGYENTFISLTAGYNNTEGYRNIFIGKDSGFTNATGYNNTFIGYQSGYLNTSSENTFIGFRSGNNNSTGYQNVFIGNDSGYSNTEGFVNTFMGYQAGYYNTTGKEHCFIGYAAGHENTTGNGSTFIGDTSGFFNTTGNHNTFVGQGSGYNNTSASDNTFIGYHAGHLNTTGHTNVFMGFQAGMNNLTGIGNVFLGASAGSNETGSHKLYIENSPSASPLIWGDFANDIVAVNGQLGVGTQTPGYPMELERTGTNASIIVDRTDGAMNYINATASFANFGSVRSHPLRLVVNGLWTMRLDSDGSLTMKNGATCTAGGEWQNASSRKLKENIRDLTAEEAAEALEGLAPVRFNYKADQEDESLGFIAEDVPDLVATKDRKGMSAMDVVTVLTKVVQEQQRTVQEQQETISELNDRIAKLENR